MPQNSILLLIFFIWSQPSFGVTGLPFPDAPCPAGSDGVREVGGYCILDYNSSASLWGPGAHFSSGGETMSNYVSFDTSYVPYTGDWKLTAYICNGNGVCTRKNSASSVSTGIQKLHVNELIAKQMTALPPGEDKTFSTAFTLCMALTGKYGDIWKPAEDDPRLFCGDAQPLPVDPTVCIINPAGSLDIDFGDIERDDMNTQSDNEQIKKTVPVICSGDSKLDTFLTFDFDSMIINNENAVLTTTDGLGAKVFYNGKPLSEQSNIELTLSPGENDFTLGFSLIRDKTVPAESIKTGKFNASIILIATEQ